MGGGKGVMVTKGNLWTTGKGGERSMRVMDRRRGSDGNACHAHAGHWQVYAGNAGAAGEGVGAILGSDADSSSGWGWGWGSG